MFSSLRVRLPLLFLAGIALAGILASLIAIQLMRGYAHNQTVGELRRDARGIAALYQAAVNSEFKGQTAHAPTFVGRDLEVATGDSIYFDGPAPLFPGDNPGIRRIDLNKVDWTSGSTLSFQFSPSARSGVFDAVAWPVRVGGAIVGAIIIARKSAETRALVVSLLERVALAGAAVLIVAGAFAYYLSRRLVRPVLGLARAADRVAGGDWDVEVPEHAPGEVGRLAERFEQMAGRLKLTETRERNFLMSVSHELRTPLTAIRGHVSALSEGLLESPELRARSLETVEAEVNRLERLVGDILDLARLDAHRFTVMREEVGMEHVVGRAYETFAEQARARGIDYDLSVEARPIVVSDGDRVLQIVDNLLSNAFRATPDGGRILLELAQANGDVRVAVEDTGPGIAPADRELLFRPFYSGGNRGTGLGLTIARELSHALGGRIEFDSELGRGSRFELVLPA